MQRECVTAPHLLLPDGYVRRILRGIGSVFIDFCSVCTVSEKTQWDLQIVGSPIRQAPEIPFASVPSGNCYELSGHSVEHSRCIPCCRNVLDELEAGLVRICRRCIRNHCKRLFEYNVERQLLSPGAHHHWTFV